MLRDAFWEFDVFPSQDLTGESLAPVAAQSDSFLSYWSAWTAGGGLDDLRATVQAARALRIRLGQARFAAQQAGDGATAAAYTEPIAEADATLAALEDALSQAESYNTTWQALASWFGSFAGWTGLGLLPAIPLGLTVAAAVAAVGALAYVVTTWQTQKTRVAFLQDIAARLEAGTLTPAEAATLTEAIDAPAGSWFAGLGTAGLIAAGVLAWALLRR